MTSPALKIIFAGTPEFAVPCLQALLDSPHEILAVYTQPDRKAGRGQRLQQSPVKTLALSHQLAVMQPLSLKDPAAQAELAAFNADLMIVVAYGLILPQHVLDLPRYGCINVHASLLPRWRGAAPIQWALLAGDRESGVTIMQMAAGLDTGPMLLKLSHAINPTETGQSLHDALSQLGRDALLMTLNDLPHLQPKPQDNTLATYATKIHKSDARIDWQHSAIAIERQIRAFYPWPIAFTTLQDETLRIYKANVRLQSNLPPPGTILSCSERGVDIAAADGIITITEVQFAGGKVLPIAEIIKARPFPLGIRCL